MKESAPGPNFEMKEKLPEPQLSVASTITSTYVDNVAVIGQTKQQVTERAQHIDAAFKAKGIPIVWSYEESVRVLETVGCIVDFGQKNLRFKPHRVWRIHLAGSGIALSRRAKVRRRVIEVWLGHATALMRLCPSLLSIFQDIYQFIRLDGDKRVPIWPSVRAEITCASNLIWLCRVDLGACFIRQVDMGDSATHGYAMMTSRASVEQIRSACSFREKWRYVPLPDSLKELMTNTHPETNKDLLYELGALEDGTRSSLSGRRSDGVGLSLSTQLGTSSMVSQFRAKKPMREDVACPALVQPLDPELVDPKSFSLLWAKSWRDPSEHINMKEARVALSSLKRTSRVASLFGMKKLTLSDNLPSVLAFEKGRSSRRGLNRFCP